MILDELVLHNVGTFAGRHELSLTPPDSQHPIVLIGGLNGTGKTTLLEAVHLALYGPLAPGSGRRSGGYESYLRSLIHRGRDAPIEQDAAVELAFHAHHEGRPHYYRVRRTWRQVASGVRDRLEVLHDGRVDHALTETWAEQVDAFLPRGIAGLFFFDGEQIEALADLERSQEVLASALAALLGLDLVDRLTADLTVVRRRRRGSEQSDTSRRRVEEHQQQVTSLRQAEEAAKADLARAFVELERAEKGMFALTERLRAAGGDLLERRDATERRLEAVRAEATRIDDELRELAAGSAPLLQVRGLLDAVTEQTRRETTAAKARVVLEAIGERDAAVLNQLQTAQVPSSAIAVIERFLADDQARRRTSAATPEITALAEAAPLEFLTTSVLETAEQRIRELLDQRRRIREEVNSAERLLAAIPTTEALAPLHIERDAAQQELARVQAAHEHAAARVTQLRQERTRATNAYERAVEDAAKDTLQADDDRRTLEHIDRVRATLQALRVAATRRHVDRICQLVLDALGRLLRKDNLITSIQIDPATYAVELTGADNRRLPAQELSAGERQLLAVALLWGLARAAGQPLPVVIDTPLGRLDRSHREHLLDRYFPQASHQVILLSTDTEIDRAAYDRLSQHVGHAYRLDFDPATGASTCRPGYFWEP